MRQNLLVHKHKSKHSNRTNSFKVIKKNNKHFIPVNDHSFLIHCYQEVAQFLDEICYAKQILDTGSSYNFLAKRREENIKNLYNVTNDYSLLIINSKVLKKFQKYKRIQEMHTRNYKR